MKSFDKCFLLLLLIFTFIITNCSTDQREEVLERYPTGSKYVVGIYKGTGTNEILLERHYFQENGKLDRIEKLEEEDTVNYLDLYPDTKTEEGLKDFLMGTWLGVNKINHSSYDVYEVFRLTFDAYDLRKQIEIMICDNNNSSWSLPPHLLSSKVSYKEDLKVEETDIEFRRAISTETWRMLASRYDFDMSDFSTTVYSELEEYRSHRNILEIDKTSFLLQFVKLDRIEIRNNSIGDTMIPYHGDSVVGTDEWFNYWGTGKVLSLMDLKFKKGGRTASCDEVEDFLSALTNK